MQRDCELNFDNDDQQNNTFFNYGICRDCNEWPSPGSIGRVGLFNKKMNCSFVNPAN